MGKLRLYDLSIPPQVILQERMEAYNALTSAQKFRQLLDLIQLSIIMNGGNPIKSPQGKGILISRKK